MKTLIAILFLMIMLMSSCTVEAALLSEAVYPEFPPYPSTDEPYAALPYDEYIAWQRAVEAQERKNGYEQGLSPFLASTSQTFLTDSDGENRVYSPLSLYMALAMLAECTGGETQQQVLTVLGSRNPDALRYQASDLWNANYRSDVTMTRTLATSLWLNEDIGFQQDTVDRLATHYYVSSYRGRMGSNAFDQELQQWLNSNTLGLLREQSAQLKLPEDSAAAIASTVAFKSRWTAPFNATNTAKMRFHTTTGDVVCQFMRARWRSDLYWGEQFQAVRLGFELDGDMWIILPDESVSPEDLLTDAECVKLITGAESPDHREMLINMCIPKFDVASQMEMSEGLQRLGISDVFDQEAADFTPLTGSELPVWLSRVQHDARIMIDEEGCQAAAYTLMLLAAGAAPPRQVEEIDFIADRPFLFVVTGANDLPLFIGIINHP